MIIKAFRKLESWVGKNGWEGYDPYDVKGTKPFLLVSMIGAKKGGKYVAHPFLVSEEKFRNTFRDLMKIEKKINPKAMALFARAYLQAFKITEDKGFLNKARECLSWLENNSSQGYGGHCWGYPFDWQSRILIPKGTPSGVVTSIGAQAFLDAFEILGDEKYLRIAKGCCDFITNDLNRDERDDKLCFSYTPLDSFHVHNANLFSASTLLRAHKASENEIFKELAIKSVNFTMSHQNDDGSWYYWAPPDEMLGIIDNYHTGFVLDSLHISKEILGGEFAYDWEMKKGFEYYKNNLFLKDWTPKIHFNKTYPVDIHSCAQGIITFSMFGEKESANKIAEWTIKNMQDDDGSFYYRIHEKGYIDKVPYIRWGQAWMLLALSRLLKVDNKV